MVGEGNASSPVALRNASSTEGADNASFLGDVEEVLAGNETEARVANATYENTTLAVLPDRREGWSEWQERWDAWLDAGRAWMAETPVLERVPESARLPVVGAGLVVGMVLVLWCFAAVCCRRRATDDRDSMLPEHIKRSDSSHPGRVQTFLRTPLGKAMVSAKKVLDIPLYFADVGSDLYTTAVFFHAGHTRWASIMMALVATSWVAGYGVALMYARVRFRFSWLLLVSAFVLAAPWGALTALYLDVTMLFFAAFRGRIQVWAASRCAVRVTTCPQECLPAPRRERSGWERQR